MMLVATESGSIATGIGNVIGNKGGVGVGLNIADRASILFINSHFTGLCNFEWIYAYIYFLV